MILTLAVDLSSSTTTTTRRKKCVGYRRRRQVDATRRWQSKLVVHCAEGVKGVKERDNTEKEPQKCDDDADHNTQLLHAHRCVGCQERCQGVAIATTQRKLQRRVRVAVLGIDHRSIEIIGKLVGVVGFVVDQSRQSIADSATLCVETKSDKGRQ